MTNHMEPLGLGEAADLAGCSRDTIRRAAQKGELKAEMGPGVRGPQWWIQERALMCWLERRDEDPVTQRSSAAPQHDDAELSTAAQHHRAELSTTPERGHVPSPPAEVYIALIDRLSRAERRSVELELQLRQSQRLLSENAESIVEKDALAREAQAQLQAVEDFKQQEIDRLAAELSTAEQQRETQIKAIEESGKAEAQRLAAELATTRQQLLEAQKPQGLLSWLGLRKRRMTSASTDKAV